MNYQMESLQNSLPPNVQSGWNDPPMLINRPIATATTAAHLKQMRTRPVDPSITGPGGYGHAYGQQNPYGQQAYGQPQAPQGYPQQPTAQTYPGQGFGQHAQVPLGGQAYGQVYPQSGAQAPQAQFSPPITQQPGQAAGQFFPGSQPSPAVPSSQSGQAPLQRMPSQPSPDLSQQFPQRSSVMAQPQLSPTVPTQYTPQPIATSQAQISPQYSQPIQQQQYAPQPRQYQVPQQQQYGGYQQPQHPPVPSQPGQYGAGQYGQPAQQLPPAAQPSPSYPVGYSNPAPSNVAYYPPADPSQQPSAVPQIMPTVQHRPIYDAFAVTSGPQTSMKDVFPNRPQTSQVTAPTPATHAAWTQAIPLKQTFRSSSLGTNTPPIMTQPIESDPSSVIFAPPNTVIADDEKSLDIGSRLNLTKPAGDVSLSGQQLVAFLYKATTRLPPAKCEGVQLKLQHLSDYVNQNRLSEACLQKLNYLVDAIDRNLFTDAAIYYEQLAAQFPQELGHWGTGIRLLVNELRGTGRVGSAGAHIRNQ